MNSDEFDAFSAKVTTDLATTSVITEGFSTMRWSKTAENRDPCLKISDYFNSIDLYFHNKISRTRIRF